MSAQDYDTVRRQIRRTLHQARGRDGEHGEARLWIDARTLDQRMTALGHPPAHPTTWGTNPLKIAAREAARRVRSPDNQPAIGEEA